MLVIIMFKSKTSIQPSEMALSADRELDERQGIGGGSSSFSDLETESENL